MTLEELIEKAIIDVKYYQDRLDEAELKLEAFYAAVDSKMPYSKPDNPNKHNEIPNFEGTMDLLDDLWKENPKS
jgi:hypothetical protein